MLRSTSILSITFDHYTYAVYIYHLIELESLLGSNYILASAAYLLLILESTDQKDK